MIKIINRTDMQHHLIPVNPWPRWAFELWATGVGDRIAAEYSNDGDSDFEVSKYRALFWVIRGCILRKVFGWWRWV